jgi:hypothetical protein
MGRTRIAQWHGDATVSGKPKSNVGAGLRASSVFPIGQASCDPRRDYADGRADHAAAECAAPCSRINRAQPTGGNAHRRGNPRACIYPQWKTQNPGHSLIILLVTDGMPEAPSSGRQCTPTLPDAQAAAQECLTQQSIQTYVLGVGANLDNLRAIAQSGGTHDAYLTNGAADVSGTILDKLNQIRDSAAVPCKFKIPRRRPRGGTLNPAQVNA